MMSVFYTDICCRYLKVDISLAIPALINILTAKLFNLNFHPLEVVYFMDFSG